MAAPKHSKMVRDLSEESEHFRAWWPEHDVRDFSMAEFSLRSARGVVSSFERLTLFPAGADGRRLVLYIPK